MKRNKVLSAIVIVFLMLSVLSGCKKQEEVKIETKSNAYFDYFDTVSFIYSYTLDDDQAFAAKCKGVTEILDKYHKLFDIYHQYEGINNLCTVNKMAGKEPVQVSDELITFLLNAKDLYYKTNGKMNVMIGALTKPWHDCRTIASNDPEKAKLPDEELLLEANKHVDIDLLVIDEENKTVYISDPNGRLDVGAYGKGYATERAADYLFEQNALGYVLNIGGNIRIIGSKLDGSGWSTGIRDPKGIQTFAIRVNIKDTACVTSGVYERYYVVDGVRYHHIIDPVTLYPALYFDSVSIICEDSGLADALSTALSCMSIEEGKEVLKNFEDVKVIWIFSDGKIETTDNAKEIIIGEER